MHVIFSFNSCLFSQSRCFFLELFLSSDLHIGLNSLSLCCLELFSFSGISLTFLECSLGSQSINFSLSISSLLLKFSKSLNFALFFFSKSLSFLLSFEFFLIFISLMLSDLIVLALFLLFSSSFFHERLSIGFSCLLHKKVDLSSLSFMSSLIFFSHFLNVSLELDLFLITDFLFLHSLNSSLLNLINDDLSTLLSSIHFSNFSFFFFLKDLKSFNFHHKIKFLLLFNPFRLKTFVLHKLFISNSDNLGVENHLVHLFDVIHLVIELFLSL